MSLNQLEETWGEQVAKVSRFFGPNRKVQAIHVPGTDTDVYAVTTRSGKQTYVAQVYNGFCEVDGAIDHPRLVREYQADIRRWYQVTHANPNPLNQQITYGNRTWNIEYEVVPKDKFIEIDGIPCLLTKRYFTDKNLRELRDEAERREHNGTLDAYNQIEDRAREWFAYMNQDTSCAYDFAPMNARLVWDKTRNKVRVLVTDLANSLYTEMSRKHNFDKTKLNKPSPNLDHGNH